MKKIRKKQHSFWNEVHMCIMLCLLGYAIPYYFPKIVAKTFKPYLNKLMQENLDEFSVYGDKKDHLEQLQKCLEECRLNGISLNLEKCAFYENPGILLKHIVCHDNLLVDPRKIIAIIIMLVLTNLIKIKQFFRSDKFLLTLFSKFC
jgi:hypothetical protein